jgi:ribosomal protein S18 acetylase RimI-like enzyme
MTRSTMNLTIRPAAKADADAIGALAAQFQAFLRDLGDRTDFAWGATEFLRDGFGERAAFAGVVAEVGGHVVGYALYHDGYETDRGRRLVHLIDLYVQEGARRQGVGRALMQRIAELGRKRGAGIVFWSVYKPNALASAFYERLGARYAAADLVWMALDL